ncbi:MAG: hypothetical protein V1712_01030 [Patescibacteria group bacterium]
MWPQSEVKRRVLVCAARKLGLRLYEGSKHTNIEQVSSGFKTQIPRHPNVKRETAKAIVRFLIEQMGFSEKEVYDALGVKSDKL